MASHEEDNREIARSAEEEPAWRTAFRIAQEEADRELLRIHREAREQTTNRELS